MSYPEKPRSNLWYLAPILGGIFGGVIAYFLLEKESPIKAKTCICISIVSVGVIGGIICYFILRKVHPTRAKLFLYIGMVFTIIAVILNIVVGITVPDLDSGFNVNV